MDKFRASNKHDSVGRILGFVILLAISYGATFGQMTQAQDIAPTTKAFLDTWLVDRNLDATLSYLSQEPVFPSCIADKGRSGVSWGKNRKAVVKNLRAIFQRAIDGTKNQALAEILERPEGVLYSLKGDKPDFARVQLGKDSQLYDVYQINDEMRERLLVDRCDDPQDTRAFVASLKKYQEAYLMVTNFKSTGGGLTFIWVRDGKQLKILTMDARF